LTAKKARKITGKKPGRRTALKARFVDEWFKGGCEDQGAAAVRAGYAEKSSHQQASRLLSKDAWVIGEIARRKALTEVDKEPEQIIDAERTINGLGNIAFGTLLDLGAFKDGEFVLDPAKITPATAMMIHEITMTTGDDGKQQFSIKFERRVPAFGMLSRILGLMTGDVHLHKHEHTHYADQTDEQLIDQIEGILEADPTLLAALSGATERAGPRTIN